ncbi:uncharacterized protein B0H18DRAFT_895015 [Fomitopsis serialis]|uniref:uncharacterized protein n=1 Tax=Fomitopsis serialis TaxID=139415 RepID=UPI002007BDD2|nr:uncharacterized protein B0H18DRAFT_895015 [Neoantrodia serialis]KAH9910598.1 hypothetical protein B0H18DRAFT_895015 [Neoantrodia serialis]
MAFFGYNDPRNALLTTQTPENAYHATLGEAVAALYAAQRTPRDVPLHLVSTSPFLTKAITTKLAGWEDGGWIGVPHADYLAALANHLRQRCAVTTVRHASTPWEWKAIDWIRDRACPLLLNHPLEVVRPTSNPSFRLSGARLASLTQATAYKGILATRRPPARQGTARNVALALAALAPRQQRSSEELWTSLRHKDIRHQVSDFLWKTLHSALRVGHFWAHIPQYKDRASCTNCRCEESIEHILLECTAVGQQQVWTMVEALWLKTGLAWPGMSLGTLLTLGTKTWTNPGSKRRREGASRLWRILVSESAYLVWKLRCERVIGHDDSPDWQHHELTVQRRWHAAIDARLQLDIASTRHYLGGRTQKSDVVLRTWNKVLEDEIALPDDWTRFGFLVGIAPVRLREHDPG